MKDRTRKKEKVAGKRKERKGRQHQNSSEWSSNEPLKARALKDQELRPRCGAENQCVECGRLWSGGGGCGVVGCGVEGCGVAGCGVAGCGVGRGGCGVVGCGVGGYEVEGCGVGDYEVEGCEVGGCGMNY
ncbi:hypothetical protein Pmani_029816 [Petrolisthes manimaculis]|uniref:Uncharacterized protein n=1 Tax=Petrolisthes manimaculis TaxID=1843537 RepID=A0AAE1TWM1_9EUCA|nr:hypothetical protein Pmani_029816 [Petrolisthes manimaculis]